MNKRDLSKLALLVAGGLVSLPSTASSDDCCNEERGVMIAKSCGGGCGGGRSAQPQSYYNQYPENYTSDANQSGYYQGSQYGQQGQQRYQSAQTPSYYQGSAQNNQGQQQTWGSDSDWRNQQQQDWTSGQQQQSMYNRNQGAMSEDQFVNQIRNQPEDLRAFRELSPQAKAYALRLAAQGRDRSAAIKEAKRMFQTNTSGSTNRDY